MILGSHPTRRSGIFFLVGALIVNQGARAQEVSHSSSADPPKPISIQQGDGFVSALTEGQVFATYDYSTYARPILYPLRGPGHVDLTRHFPMREGVPGEAADHPHHKSVWFAHGDVNGLDFWSEKARIANQSLEILEGDASRGPGWIAVNHWLKGDDTLLTERATIRFVDRGDLRLIDFEFQLTANTDVTFGDTKEGTFAIRTHPNLQLRRDDPSLPVGHAENSAGQTDGAIWGQPAKWVCYYGQIGDAPMGLALFDHPGNLRHPTTWHARDYGLVGANPFGLHDFLKQPAGSGDFSLPAGQRTTFRYCIALFGGDFAREKIEQWYSDFAGR